MDKAFSIRFKNYKCFSEETTIDNIKKVNLLIGRNNCGKTSALELIRAVITMDLSDKKIKNTPLENCVIEYGTTITDELYSNAFPKGESPDNLYYLSGPLPEHYSYYYKGKELLNTQCFFPLLNTSRVDDVFLELQKKKPSVFCTKTWNSLKGGVINGLRDRWAVFRIAAERDIKKENRIEDEEPPIDSNGSGITQYIERCLNRDKGNYKLVKEDILNALNGILKGESSYSDIDVLDDGKQLEIFLYEKDRRIPLSQMGSGLKTIIFVLLELYMSEDNHGYRPLFLFEELENNLHPEIQRRLLDFIYKFVTASDGLAFITSHSHVAINCFYNKDDTAIFHVYKTENGSSTIEAIQNSADKASILNDLGVLASDIFQSNGIIWVEGPSDRVYIKKWLAIKYPELKENEDFTFLYYGGKNLAHFTADDKKENCLINVLLANRNGLIVMDHDGASADEGINNTKKRVKDEFESKGMYVWVTEGKEIENYLKASDINASFNEDSQLGQVGPFQPFKDYISSLEPSFPNQKVAFSQKMVFNEESLEILDLKKRIDDIAGIIKKWNRLS